MSNLTDVEACTIKELGSIYTVIAQLIVGDGPSRSGDLQEIAFHIHALQRMVGAQAAAREHPDLFRLLGETLRG